MTTKILYRRRRACFHCGTIGSAPCRGHESGGMIDVWQVRPGVPYWLCWLTGGPR